MNSDQVPDAGPEAAGLGALLVHELRRCWINGQQPDVVEFLAGRGPFSAAQLAALLRLDQQRRWSIGERISAESYLRRFPALAQDSDCVLDVIYSEYLVRETLDEQPSADEYADRFPQFATTLRQQIAFHGALRPPKRWRMTWRGIGPANRFWRDEPDCRNAVGSGPVVTRRKPR